MGKMFMSYFGLDTLVSFSATPIEFGEIVPTKETRHLQDADPDSYTYIWGDGDQPIRVNYDGLDSLPTTVFDADGNHGFYIRYDRDVFDVASGVNFWRHTTSATAGGAHTTLDVFVVHGDDSGNAPNDTDVYCSGVSFVAGNVAQTIFTAEGISTVPFQWLLLGTVDAVGDGENERVFDVDYGILIDLPDGYITEDETYTDKYFGGDLSVKPFGQPAISSVLTSGKKRKVTLEFRSMTESQRDLVFNIWKYNRGSIPMVYLPQPDTNVTWIRGVSKKLTMSEPFDGGFDVTMELETI